MLLFNRETMKQLLFPIVFLFFLMPLPSEIIYNIGAQLSILSSNLAFMMLQILGLPVSMSSEYGTPAIILTQEAGTQISFTVDLACSGIYSLLGFFIFAIFLAYIVRDKTWKKGSILLLGIPTIYFLLITKLLIPIFSVKISENPFLGWIIGSYILFIPIFILSFVLFKIEGKGSWISLYN